MPAKLCEVEILRRISESDFQFVSWCEPGFIGTRGYVYLRCPKGHVTRKQVGNTIYAKSGCVDCFNILSVSDKTRLPADQRILDIENAGVKFVAWDMSGYKNNKSRCVVICHNGHQYKTSVTNIVDRKRGCRKCASAQKAAIMATSEDDAIDILLASGFKFVEWVGAYAGVHSRAEVTCENGHRVIKTPVSCTGNKPTGCSVCSKKYKKTREEMIDHIRSFGYEVISYETPGKYRRSDVVVLKCESGHVWTTKAVAISNGHGCPSCAKYGFDKSSPAILYALLSDDGLKIKIGITGHIEARMSQLKSKTPFGFEKVAMLKGDGDMIAKLEAEAHARFKSAGLSGFDGATEWLEWSPELHKWLADNA